jgi:hypothetical protein
MYIRLRYKQLCRAADICARVKMYDIALNGGRVIDPDTGRDSTVRTHVHTAGRNREQRCGRVCSLGGVVTKTKHHHMRRCAVAMQAWPITCAVGMRAPVPWPEPWP